MGTMRSPMISAGLSIRQSWVWFTAPSVEFSMGATPWSARPDSTAAKTSSMPRQSSSSQSAPAPRSAAAWEKVPGGPR